MEPGLRRGIGLCQKSHRDRAFDVVNVDDCPPRMAAMHRPDKGRPRRESVECPYPTHSIAVSETETGISTERRNVAALHAGLIIAFYALFWRLQWAGDELG